MSTAELTKRMTPSSTRVRSRLIGAYYLLTILTGAFVLLFHGRLAVVADLVVGMVYLLATAFIYGLSAPANRKRS